jgi:hypothetical protein
MSGFSQTRRWPLGQSVLLPAYCACILLEKFALIANSKTDGESTSPRGFRSPFTGGR